ncbi:MAG: alpha/beta hydrolase [Dokdonella sp.]
MDSVICLHDAAGGGWQFAVWQRVLAAHGVSSRVLELRAATTAGEDGGLAAYRQQISDHCALNPQPVLIGIGMGGLLALMVAADCAVAALVLINPWQPGGFEPSTAVPSLDSARRRSLRDISRALPDADHATRLIAFRQQRCEPAWLLPQLQQAVTLEKPACPLLLLASGGGRDVPSELSRGLASRLRADFELLPDCSHLGPLLGVRAASVAERVAAWLASRAAFSAAAGDLS